MAKTPYHKQVQTDRCLVDEGIAELLAAFWDLGFETNFSCQGTVHPLLRKREQEAYISFKGTEVQSFLRQAARQAGMEPVTGFFKFDKHAQMILMVNGKPSCQLHGDEMVITATPNLNGIVCYFSPRYLEALTKTVRNSPPPLNPEQD